MEVISAWELYLWTRLDYLQGAFLVLSIIAAFGAVFGWMLGVLCEGGPHWYGTGPTIAIFFFMALFVLTPNQKEAAMIIVIPKIVNNQEVQEGAKQVVGEAKEIYDIAKSALKEYAGVKDE
jgi:hypothetical protein